MCLILDAAGVYKFKHLFCAGVSPCSHWHYCEDPGETQVNLLYLSLGFVTARTTANTDNFTL